MLLINLGLGEWYLICKWKAQDRESQLQVHPEYIVTHYDPPLSFVSLSQIITEKKYKYIFLLFLLVVLKSSSINHACEEEWDGGRREPAVSVKRVVHTFYFIYRV